MKNRFLIVLFVFLCDTSNGQVKPVIFKTFGNPDFYQSLSENEKCTFFETLKVLKIDTSNYKILNNIGEYYEHVKLDSVGGLITSSSYKKYDKSITVNSFVRKKNGEPITKPVLYITYWKDPEDDYLDFLFMTKN